MSLISAARVNTSARINAAVAIMSAAARVDASARIHAAAVDPSTACNNGTTVINASAGTSYSCPPDSAICNVNGDRAAFNDAPLRRSGRRRSGSHYSNCRRGQKCQDNASHRTFLSLNVHLPFLGTSESRGKNREIQA